MSYSNLQSSDHNNIREVIELNELISDEKFHPRSPEEKAEGRSENESSPEDTLELIEPSLEQGEYNDYEEILKVVGFGLGHILLMIGTGVAVFSDGVEIISISFILPIIGQPSELGITHWQNGLLSSIMFIGMLIGGYTWGGVADITGRRSTLITSLSVNGIFGASSAFSPNFYMLLIFRFFSGVGVGGSLPVINAYSSEFIRNRYRGPYLTTLASFWMVGALLCGVFAWIILPVQFHSSLGSITFHSWRLYILISALPSITGAVLFFVMPESPRFLLEIGKEERALKILKKIYLLNCIHRRYKYPPFPIKSARLSGLRQKEKIELDGQITVSFRRRFKNVSNGFKEILRRTLQLYHKHLVKSTILLMLIYFCLSFGTYGVTLWYPTYVHRLSQESMEDSGLPTVCNKTVKNFTVDDSDRFFDKLACKCPGTNFTNVTLDGLTLSSWRSYNVSFNCLTISGGHYSGVWFEGVVWSNVTLDGVKLTNANFLNLTLDGVLFRNVTFVNSFWCGVKSKEAINLNSTKFINTTVNGVRLDDHLDKSLFEAEIFNESSSSSSNASCLTGQSYNCLEPPTDVNEEYRKEYFYDFLIAGSAFPGNLVSAITVYLFRRSYLLAFSLLCSTVSVFLLFFVHSEVYSVLILCLYKVITVPEWNVIQLLVVEIYPTSLRTTASGVLLLLARIGAIIGTYVFGAFSNTDQISVPIILTAAVLLVASIASLFLPKTNRKTRLM